MLPSIERTEPARTVIVPRVQAPPSRSRLRFLLPWLAFGAVAVVVVVGSSLWSVTLRSAGRTASEPAGIGAVVAPTAPPPVTALPTTPAAAMVTTEVVVHSPRMRMVAPPPAPARPSVTAPPSAPPVTGPVQAIAPHPVECVDPLSCAASSAPSSRTKKKSVDESTTVTADEA